MMEKSDKGIMTELWAGGPVFRQAEHFRLSTDSVLLADFAEIKGQKRVIDLGCSSGILGLLLLSRNERLSVTGLEIMEEAVAAARENMEVNGFTDRVDIIRGDIRENKSSFPTGCFDAVISNPPYYSEGSGAVSPDPGRAVARSEVSCTLEDICSAAAYLCKTGGSVFLSGKPERLGEYICLMSGKGIEPKRLRFVTAKSDRSPSLFLIEGKRGAKPGLRVEGNLVLANSDGSESEEYKRIYHR